MYVICIPYQFPSNPTQVLFSSAQLIPAMHTVTHSDPGSFREENDREKMMRRVTSIEGFRSVESWTTRRGQRGIESETGEIK